MDWITLTIELVGVAILIAWIVIPIKEFREILRVVGRKHEAAAEPAVTTTSPATTSPVMGQSGKDGPRA